jgi:hypothetical protein
VDERWIPILAGVIGVVGGLGGAVVGGVIANEGQEEQFEKDRAAELQDLRERAYVKFVGVAEKVRIRGELADVAEVNAAMAEVSILSPTLEQPALRLIKAAGSFTGDETPQQERKENTRYSKNLERFVVLAQKQIGIEE